MKRILMISLLLLIAALAVSMASAHEEHDMCEEHPTGMDFGQHVAEHAQAGMLGKEHNPGMHQGFSPCVR